MLNSFRRVTGAPAPLFSRKSLIRLLWPLVVEQLLAITLGIADIIMVSSRGEAAVSGVSLVDTVFVLINGVFAALATGGAVVCSQYLGKKSPDAASKTARQLIYTVIAFSLAVMIVGFAGGMRLLSTMFGAIDDSVMGNARVYFFYTLLSMPSVAVYNACAALFRAEGNSRVSMLMALVINILNIGGNAILLFGLGMGVEGVAIPTLVSRTVAAVVLTGLLLGERRARSGSLSLRGLERVTLDRDLVVKILRIGVPNGLENGMFQLGKILMLGLVASFGTSAIAANAAANSVSTFEVLPGSAIGLALLTVVGQCMGANRPEEAARYTKALLALAYAATIAVNVPLLLLGGKFIAAYGLSPETALLARKMFSVHGFFAMFFWPASFTLPNALRAAADAKYAMTVSLLSMWIVRIGLSYVFALPLGLGALGVWLAMICDWVVRVFFFVGRFARGKWKRQRLV